MLTKHTVYFILCRHVIRNVAVAHRMRPAYQLCHIQRAGQLKLTGVILILRHLQHSTEGSPSSAHDVLSLMTS